MGRGSSHPHPSEEDHRQLPGFAEAGTKQPATHWKSEWDLERGVGEDAPGQLGPGDSQPPNRELGAVGGTASRYAIKMNPLQYASPTGASYKERLDP